MQPSQMLHRKSAGHGRVFDCLQLDGVRSSTAFEFSDNEFPISAESQKIESVLGFDTVGRDPPVVLRCDNEYIGAKRLRIPSNPFLEVVRLGHAEILDANRLSKGGLVAFHGEQDLVRSV